MSVEPLEGRDGVESTVVYEVPHQAAKKTLEQAASMALLHSSLQALGGTGDTDEDHDDPSGASGRADQGLALHVGQMGRAERERFRVLCHSQPDTVQLSEADRDMLWRLRRVLRDRPLLLPLFLLAVDWLHLESVSEAYRMLHEWAPPGRFTALQLLGGRFPDPKVRAYAVQVIAQTSEDEFCELVVPLVRQLRFEGCHDNALARLLLRRALDRPATIGHALYWQLQSCARRPELSPSATFYAHLYLRCCGDVHRAALGHTTLLMLLLGDIARQVQAEKTSQRRLDKLHSLLRSARARLPPIFQHPSSPAHQTKGFITAACYVMEHSHNKTLTLYLVLENARRGERPFALHFKTGFDPRGETLAGQLMRTMDMLLKDPLRHETHLSCEMGVVGPSSSSSSSSSTAAAAGLSTSEVLRELEGRAGSLDLLLPSGYRSIALGDCCLYDVPPDAVSINYLAQQVAAAARFGGGENARDAEALSVPPSAKLLGREFPNDFVANWFKLCSMDPLGSHSSANGSTMRAVWAGMGHAGSSQRLGPGGGGARGPRRNAFSGPCSVLVRAKSPPTAAPAAPPALGMEGIMKGGGLPLSQPHGLVPAPHPLHSAWRARLCKSLAGFYLSSSVLGMSGRSADNVLLRPCGDVVTVEPVVLGFTSQGGGYGSRPAREPVPLLPAFVFALGGADAAMYKAFEGHVLAGLGILRRHVSALCDVVEVLLGAGEVGPEVLVGLQRSLRQNLLADESFSEEQARKVFRSRLLADRAEYSQCAGACTYPAAPMSDGWFG